MWFLLISHLDEIKAWRMKCSISMNPMKIVEYVFLFVYCSTKLCLLSISQVFELIIGVCYQTDDAFHDHMHEERISFSHDESEYELNCNVLGAEIRNIPMNQQKTYAHNLDARHTTTLVTRTITVTTRSLHNFLVIAREKGLCDKLIWCVMLIFIPWKGNRSGISYSSSDGGAARHKINCVQI